jgi:cytochrome c biogenesis protein CcdA
MTHLPFVAASYVLGFGVPLVLAVLAWQRLGTAKRRLAAIDPRLGARR